MITIPRCYRRMESLTVVAILSELTQFSVTAKMAATSRMSRANALQVDVGVFFDNTHVLVIISSKEATCIASGVNHIISVVPPVPWNIRDLSLVSLIIVSALLRKAFVKERTQQLEEIGMDLMTYSRFEDGGDLLQVQLYNYQIK